MKKVYIVFLIFILFFPFSVSAIKNQDLSYIVLETTTQRILEGKNINKQSLVASTAKIMTAITTIENYELSETICIKKESVLEVGSKVYLKENEQLSRKDLLYALMLRSANDAASALSGHNSEEFIRQMNHLAKKIGMKNSVFVNASGLDEKEYNISTAYDMALLSAYASKNEIFVKISSTHQYRCSSNLSTYVWKNKHKLVVNEEGFLWGKTGFTKKSRRVLVSNYQKENKNLILVTISDGDDWNHHKNLIKQNEQYNFIVIFKKGIYDTKQDVPYYIYIPSDIVIPIKKKEKENVHLNFNLYKTFAVLEIFLEGNLVIQKNIEVYNKENLDIDLVLDVFK